MLATRATMALMFVATAAAVPAGSEWIGVFPITTASSKWSMQKVGGAYADATMKMVFMPVSAATEAEMEAHEAEVATLLAGTCAVKEAGESMKPAASGSCFEFHVGTGDDSEWTIDTSGVTAMVIAAQHVPTEFERDKHYFYTSGGVDIEPAAQEGGGGHGHGGAEEDCDGAAADPHAGHDHGRRRRLSDDPHAGHDHGEPSDACGVGEWCGVFSVAAASHTWIMQKVCGAYADATMKVVLIPSAADKSELDTHKAAAATLMEGTCTVKEAGEAMGAPAAGGTCFELHVGTGADSTWTIDTSGTPGLAVWTQHVPTEFERDMHYFKDSAGTDIEPLTYVKRWGPAIGAGMLVNVVTLVGVIFLVPVLGKLALENPDCYWPLLNAGGAGALIACAFYLMFTEGYLYVATGGAEANTAFVFGTMVLLGCITASLLDFLVILVMPKPKAPAKDVEAPAGEASAVEAKSTRARVLCAVLIGDFMHNFCDGIFMGVAFTGCSNAMAWGITIATFIHEIAQELADYVVLTDPKQGNLKPLVALILNFVSGLSIILGIVIIMSMEEINGRTVGCLLTFGGGIYIEIGLAEMLPRTYAAANTVGIKLASILMFCLGAVAIGIILISHEHCIPEGDDSHAGHDHGRMLSFLF